MRLCDRHNELLSGITTRCSRYIITAPISFRNVSRETLPLMLESLQTQQRYRKSTHQTLPIIAAVLDYLGHPTTSNYILLCSTWNIAFLWSKLCAINRTFPRNAQFNICQAQERRLSLPHTTAIAFHTVSRDTSIYLSCFKNTGIHWLTSD